MQYIPLEQRTIDDIADNASPGLLLFLAFGFTVLAIGSIIGYTCSWVRDHTWRKLWRR